MSMAVELVVLLLFSAGIFVLSAVEPGSFLAAGRACCLGGGGRILERFTQRAAAFPFFERRRRRSMETEISDGISFLRNLTIIGEGRRLSADSVIEQLADRKGSLSPVYAKMLRFLRQNQKGEALNCFSEEVRSDLGQDFARLLLQWDEIDPQSLMETLLSHQKAIKEGRITALKKRDELISDLIYLPAVINVVLIFINFIYVGYFISQKDLFEMFF